MKRLMEAIFKLLQGLSDSSFAFSLDGVLFALYHWFDLLHDLFGHKSPDLIIQKLMFVFLLGSFIGVTAQFASERFSRLGGYAGLCMYWLRSLPGFII
jgi:hypothetical protein